ncbi:RNA polymerase sigma factor SigW [Effusibacillus lacus]|uniref:RNA polymerase sigma factor SigW n=1 Tax=Effusibacillus lacus TaxID=1348429 RepID=A0A292YBR4_9BACL|nr:RNA polymerase sigma factor SigW [Effusibacillus lacus]TCS68530.1 RNA polymerase sigma (SigW) subunit [Effusibacillus lacus]GAX88412.1 RNA polymerase subunit sigma-24 [Effusibacillus lacus]
MDLLEAKIVTRAQKGDRIAFAELVELYKDKLYNLSYRMLGNPHDAEEMTQEAFLKAYANLKKYDSRHKFSTWIYRIATNCCIDRLRKKKADYSLDAPLDSDDGGDMYSVLSSGDSPEFHVIAREQRFELQSAIEQLPPSYRAVVILKYIEDLSMQEIADILALPVSTVKTRLHRGREALRTYMIQ